MSSTLLSSHNEDKRVLIVFKAHQNCQNHNRTLRMSSGVTGGPAVFILCVKSSHARLLDFQQSRKAADLLKSSLVTGLPYTLCRCPGRPQQSQSEPGEKVIPAVSLTAWWLQVVVWLPLKYKHAHTSPPVFLWNRNVWQLSKLCSSVVTGHKPGWKLEGIWVSES